MNKNRLWLIAVLIIGIGGYWAYDAYQEQKRQATWDALLSGPDCDSCAARKQSMAKNVEERKALKNEEQAE